MAVVLKSKDFASRLNIGNSALLQPAANDVLQRWPVSRRVVSSRAPADDPTLIERVEVEEQTECCFRTVMRTQSGRGMAQTLCSGEGAGFRARRQQIVQKEQELCVRQAATQ